MKKIFEYIKKHKVWTGIGVVCIALVLFLMAKGGSKNDTMESIVKAAKSNVIEQVSVTGSVEPAEGVELAFESGGKIVRINTKLGKKVKAGATLMSLNNADMAANVRRANASIGSAQADVLQYSAILDSEKAKLDQLKRGGTTQEIQIAQADVAKAEQAVEDARKNVDIVEQTADLDLENTYDDVSSVLQEVYIDTDIAFNQTINPLFIEGYDFDYLSFNTKDSDKRTDIEREKITMKRVMDELKLIVESVPTDQIGRDTSLVQASLKLSRIYSFFVHLDSAIADNSGLSQTEEATYRGYATSARTSINAAISSIVAQQQAISTQKTTNAKAIQTAQASVEAAKHSLEISKQQLILKQSPAGPEELSAQEALVRRAEANLKGARARVAQAAADAQGFSASLAKTIIRAPFDGVVTKIDAKRGQIVSMNTPVVSVISDALFQIKAYIPEADIAKIEIGKEADITLDAYGDTVVFKGTISEIDLSETVIEGVPTYKVIIQFVQKDDRIKSGMTANIDITTHKKDDVIVLPQRAIISKDNQRFVVVAKGDGTSEERKVETGIRSIDGSVEIISGVSEGESIIVDSKKGIK